MDTVLTKLTKENMSLVDKKIAKEQMQIAQEIWRSGAIYKDIDKVFDKSFIISNFIYIIKEALARGYLDIARRATKDLQETLEGKNVVPFAQSVQVSVSFTKDPKIKTVKAVDINTKDNKPEDDINAKTRPELQSAESDVGSVAAPDPASES